VLVYGTANVDIPTIMDEVIAITGRVRSCYTGPKMSGMTKCA
jgi:hypothetical protein